MKVSVIVTTYNKERELSLVLEAYRYQQYQDFEIVVADDGSGPATKEVIEEARGRLKVPVKHSWQEDDGFRAARSRNLAIKQCEGEIIAMTDGDCLPMPDYLSCITTNFASSSYRAGERFFLTEEEAAAVELELMQQSGAEYLKSLVPAREVKRVLKIARKNKWYRLFRLKVRPKVMTCNFVVRKSDLERVNGFDERYVGWGHEDTDLGRRLREAGIRSVESLSPGEMIHLWHKGDESFAGRVRDCPNAVYFDRGFHLKKCRLGLIERGFKDIDIAMSGAIPEFLKSEYGQKKGAEVELLWSSGAGDRFSSGAEIQIYLIDSIEKVSKSAISKADVVFARSDLRDQLESKLKKSEWLDFDCRTEKGFESLQDRLLALI